MDSITWLLQRSSLILKDENIETLSTVDTANTRLIRRVNNAIMYHNINTHL